MTRRRHRHQGFAITRRDTDGDPYEALSYGRDAERESSKTSVMREGRDALGVAAGAGATGLLVGRLNHWDMPGTPIPWGLALGGLFLALGMKYDQRDMIHVGEGAIASWATMMGAGWGQQMRAGAGEAITPITSGCSGAALPASRHVPAHLQGRPRRRLSEVELVDIMHGGARR